MLHPSPLRTWRSALIWGSGLLAGSLLERPISASATPPELNAQESRPQALPEYRARLTAIQTRQARFDDLIRDLADQLEIRVDRKEVQREMEQLSLRYGSAWPQYLEQTGQSEASVSAKVVSAQLRRRVIERLTEERLKQDQPINHPVLMGANRAMTPAEVKRLRQRQIVEELYRSVDEELTREGTSIKSYRVKTRALHTDFVKLPHDPQPHQRQQIAKE